MEVYYLAFKIIFEKYLNKKMIISSSMDMAGPLLTPIERQMYNVSGTK